MEKTQINAAPIIPAYVATFIGSALVSRNVRTPSRAVAPRTSWRSGWSSDVSRGNHHCDMKPSSGRYKDKVLQGIAKLDGDTLTVAFAEPGKDRPTSFESKPGSGVVVAVHKKAK